MQKDFQRSGDEFLNSKCEYLQNCITRITVNEETWERGEIREGRGTPSGSIQTGEIINPRSRKEEEEGMLPRERRGMRGRRGDSGGHCGHRVVNRGREESFAKPGKE
jgi:hypothetical protein